MAKKDARSRAVCEKTKEAFLRLKKTREFYEITVSCVCREAGISRGAFYNHYANMADLLEEILEDVFAEITGVVEQVSRDAGVVLRKSSLFASSCGSTRNTGAFFSMTL